MDILNFFNPKKEGKSIGQFEAGSEDLASGFTNFMSSMGMTNPVKLTKKGTKGVIITKKGDKYRIKLLMFKPPIEVEWTGITSINTLFETLDTLATGDRKIAYLNLGKLETGLQFFQLALSFQK